MKTKLFRKNVCLGVLMLFVLVLGVQGVVEAITVPAGTDQTAAYSGIIALRSPFTAFTISLDQDELKESVRISTNGGVQLTASNKRYTSLTLTEKNADGTALPSPPTANGELFSGSTKVSNGGSVTITGYFTSLGKRTITITDNTPTSTSPSYTRQPAVTYTYYVVKPASDIRSTDTIRFTKGGSSVNSQGYITKVEGRDDFYVYNGGNDYPVTYELGTLGSTSPKLYIKALDGSNIELGSSTSISSRIRVWLDANGSGLTSETFNPGYTNIVTATIGTGPSNIFKVAYIYGTPKLAIQIAPADLDDPIPDPLVTQEDITTNKPARFTNGTAGKKAGTIQATIMDGQTTPEAVEDVVVKFDVVDKSIRGGYLSQADRVGTIVNDKNRIPSSSPPLAKTFYVRTDDSGQAKLTYQMGTASGRQRITVTAVGLKSKEVTAELVSSGVSSKQFVIKTNQKRTENSKKFDLIAEVTDEDDNAVSGQVVTFRTDHGTLTRISDPPSTNPITTDEEVNVVTDSLGQAYVVYDIGDNKGRQEIDASIVDNGDRQSVTFVVNGGASTPSPPATTPLVTPSLTITTTGEGTTRSVTVTARNAQNAVVPGIGATLSGTALTTSQIVITGTPVSITLPTTPGTYTLQAVAGGYTTANINVTVAAAPQPGTLSIGLVGTQVNGQQTIEVTARTSAGTAPSGGLTVSLSGAGISRTVATTNGSGRAIIALPATPATLTASATGYTSGTLTLPARTTTTTTTTTPTTPTGGTAESIEIDGNRQISGTLAVATPLRVRVLDANAAGVSKVGVVFRVLTPGAGTFAGARGSGRAIRLETDRSGTARANFTPTTEGDIIVEAKAAGVTAPVTFIIDVGETSTPTTPATSPNTGETPEPRRTIDPEVLMGAAQRPPMLWVDGGVIYALVGADVQEFAIGVENVQNLAVSGNKVYWTERTGENAGTINAMNLDGTGAKQLVSIKAVPKGIAVDSVGKRLYWTNSHGWIQSSNLQGTARRNVAKGLSNPMGIAVAAGKTVYWTEEGPSSPELLNGHTGQSVPGGSVAISGNTLYWTAKTGENAGTIHSVNLNGTGAKHLVSIKAVPMGITVDPVAKRLYWTNSHGWIQSSNLQGTARRNVAKGLGSPGGIALSANIKAPATTPTTTSTPVSGGGSKYDVNGDGTVDSKDVDAVLLAVSAGLTLAKYDVNGDKNVDIKDIMAVNANLTAGAAGAPTLLGTKFTAIEIDRLQAQIDLLIATGDRSPAALKTLIYLQQLIAMARPEKTQLLANYPNPFNPETWIPYELATDTDVRITIYNAQGVVIRTLQLGQQSAGYYTDRERAAYWDGRNALGEQVASGIYFYQLETDAMSSLRKMVILK